jgi:superfamily II DNA or RNA helicase
MARQSKRTITATVGGKLVLQRDEVPRDLFDVLLSHLTWENPEFKDRRFRQQPTRYYEKRTRTWIEIPQYIHGIQVNDENRTYEIAREFTSDLQRLCDEREIEIEWEDTRVLHASNPLPNAIELWEPQKAAVRDLLDDTFGHQGVLEAPCGSGKTVILLHVAAELGQPTLILAHTDDLLNQWRDYCHRLLDYTPGLIQGDIYDVKQITLASVMTLARRDLDDEFLSMWGCVILDEAHHCPAACFQDVMTQFPAYYRFGATATPEREDNLQGLLYAICGPVIAKVERRALRDAGLIVDPTVQAHETGFRYPYTNLRQWHQLVRGLIQDEDRNNQIIENIISEHDSGNHVQLVLSQQIDHLVILSDSLAKRRPDISQELLIAGGVKKDRAGRVVRTVGRTKAERLDAIKRARKGRLRILFGTQLADEGLDIPRLDRLHLVFPTRAKGKIAQQVGRIQRVHPGKTDVIVHDYVDEPSVLKSQWFERRKVYTSMELEVVRENKKTQRSPTLAATAGRIRRATKEAREKHRQHQRSSNSLLRA